MFFNSWHALLRVLIVGTSAYVALLVLLRATGKRTLSKMNAFDFIVTVALGSTLATVILSHDVALADGVEALALLVLLQFVVTWCSVRWSAVSRLVKAEPTLLAFRGGFLPGAMRRQRVTEGEVLAAVRRQGIASLDEVEAVVIETAGSITVVRRPPTSPADTLRDIQAPDAPARASEAEGPPGP